jgi:hypothetical protein
MNIAEIVLANKEELILKRRKPLVKRLKRVGLVLSLKQTLY